jgi:hypothetical protein
MSDWHNDKAEELIDDPIISASLKAKAREYLRVRDEFSEQAATEVTSAQKAQAADDEKCILKAKEAGWTKSPALDSMVEITTGRYKGRKARVRGYLFGRANIELIDSPTLMTGVPLHKLRPVQETTTT